MIYTLCHLSWENARLPVTYWTLTVGDIWLSWHVSCCQDSCFSFVSSSYGSCAHPEHHLLTSFRTVDPSYAWPFCGSKAIHCSGWPARRATGLRSLCITTFSFLFNSRTLWLETAERRRRCMILPSFVKHSLEALLRDWHTSTHSSW